MLELPKKKNDILSGSPLVFHSIDLVGSKILSLSMAVKNWAQGREVLSSTQLSITILPIDHVLSAFLNFGIGAQI